jgi:hypothetical protein
MSSVQRLWVGYSRNGGRAHLELGGPGSKVLLLGSRASEMAALAAISAKEAGGKPVILDLEGSLANRLSGYFDTYDYHSFLYDAFRLESPEPWHSQLAAAAYCVALDLSSEEEAIINSALQSIASEGSLASPVAIYDVLGKVEGFRGFYVDKLKGRIGALRLFDAVDDQRFGGLAKGNALLDFHRASYPQAAELAVALFLAKLLAVDHAEGTQSRTLILTEAHRVFRSTPRLQHSKRLQTQLFEWLIPAFVSSDQRQALSPAVLEACPIRMLSSYAWHSIPRNQERILPGTLVLEDRRTGRQEHFVPRPVVSKTGEYASARSAPYAPPALTSTILEAIERFPLSTRESVVQYVSPEFLPSDVNSELNRLHSHEYLITEPKESGSGPRIFAYTLSEKGRKLLQELRQ